MGEMYEIGRWRELVPLGLDFRLDAPKTALVLVDIQRKTCDRKAPRGAGKTLFHTQPQQAEVYFTRLEQVVLPNVQRLLRFFRERNLKVMHFVVGPGLATGEDLPLPFKLVYLRGLRADEIGVIYKGTPEFEIMDEVKPREDELVLHKVTYNGFTATGADLLLRNMGIEGIVLVGGHTHVCVEATGRGAADLGFKVVVVEDAVINLIPLMHDAAMITFSSFIGRVMTTDELLAELA